MATPYRTLEQLRRELSARLGFGAQHSHVNKEIIESFLRSANEQLWIQVQWKHKRRSSEVTLAGGGRFIPYPSDCEPGFLTGIFANISGQWQALCEGIESEARLLQASAAYPLHYAESFESGAAAQIEVWPAVAVATPIRIEYTASPTAFLQPNDRPSVPDDLVFLHALVNAKLHYRQPDGQGYASQLEAMLDKYKAMNFGRRVFSPRSREIDPYTITPARVS